MPLYTDQYNQVSYDQLCHFIDTLAQKHKLPNHVKDILQEQAEKLKAFYGNLMDKNEVLKVLSTQLNLTKTGYLRTPVGIVEFLESPEYMDQGQHVRPRIMEHLVNLFDPTKIYHEVVLGGAIGIGKNYFADMGMAYDLYKLSCLFSPQAHYDLAPGSSIVYSMQSKTFDLAKKVIYQQFKERLSQTFYFTNTFKPNPLIKAELQFPHSISILPVSSTDTSALGLNITGAILDELNFMKRRKDRDSSVKDLAERLYTTIVRRIESRFTITGKSGGRVYLVSSTKHKGDFIDKKEKEAKTNPHIYVMHMAQWEALPAKFYKGKTFFVQLPSAHTRGKVFEQRPPDAILVQPKTARGKVFEVIEVPSENKKSFEKDFLSAVRDIAGVPLERISRFIDIPAAKMAQQLHHEYYSSQIFKEDVFTLTPSTRFEEIINYEFLVKLIHMGPFSLHVDLAISQDSAGLAVSHVIGSKGEGQTHLPIYGVAGAAKISPPVIGEIDLKRLGQLVVEISKYVELCAATMDRYQAAYLSQVFRLNKLPTWIVSVDREPDPYDIFNYSLKEQRIYLPPSDALNEELASLKQDADKGLVDHDVLGSKDMSDAVAASVYNLSQRKSSYRVIGNPTPLATFIPLTTSQDRPSSGRETFY